MILLHGWEPHLGWYGPHELPTAAKSVMRLLGKIESGGDFYHGNLSCRLDGYPGVNFCTLIYDLEDSALALIDFRDVAIGPTAALLVVPSGRRPELRPEFAFEFLGFLRFLRAIPVGQDLAIHDYLEATLAAADPSATLAFSIATCQTDEPVAAVLATHVERLANAIAAWVDRKDTRRNLGVPVPLGTEIPPGRCCGPEAVC